MVAGMEQSGESVRHSMTCHIKHAEHSGIKTARWSKRMTPQGWRWFAICEECAKNLPVAPIFDDKRAAWETRTDWSKDGETYYYCGQPASNRDYEVSENSRRKR